MKWFALAFLILFAATPAAAQPQGETLRVATRLVKPFAFEEGGNLTGFSIELWNQIAEQMGVRTQWSVHANVGELLEVTRSRQADLAIAAISITEERERGWDFSQPMFDAGLQILVPSEGGGGNLLAVLLEAILSPAFLIGLAIVVLAVVLAGHVVWLFERGRPNSMIESRSYFPGIFEACWWACATLATQADSMPRSAAARIAAIVWMFTAVIFIAFFTAAVTSSLTLQGLKGAIDGPEDLPGKRVATVRASTSAAYLREIGVTPTEFNTIDEVTQTLLNGEADAVVYDAPILQYFATHEGKGKVQVVGPVFRKENYGILFPAGSPLRKPVNEALLRLKANGSYDRLAAKYFGQETERGK